MKITALFSLAYILLVNQTNERLAKNVFTVNNETGIFQNILLQAKPSDTTIDAALNKLYKHGMPLRLSDAIIILGKNYKLTKSLNPADFDDYTWKTKTGLELNFEDINYNEKGIELDRLTITATGIVKHPLGIYLNKSSLSACKKTFASLKKSLDERTYKFSKNKDWYFLEFNKQNVLIKIKSVDWDTDYSG